MLPCLGLDARIVRLGGGVEALISVLVSDDREATADVEVALEALLVLEDLEGKYG